MSRPRYLEDYGVPPPSQVPKQKRATVEYRCERLIGLVNLYYWAMEWTVHWASKWRLGEKRYAFSLSEKQLWLLGLETIEQVGKTLGDQRIYVHAQQATPPRRRGSFVLGSIRWGQSRRSVSAIGVAAEGDEFDHEPPGFVVGDRVLRLDFPDDVDVDHVPWPLISGMLDQGYTNATNDLTTAGINWTGPPLFRQFWSGQELARDIEVRKLESRVVLQDLEARRKEVVGDVEHAMRVRGTKPNHHEEHLMSDLKQLTGLVSQTLNKYAKAAGVQTPSRGQKNYRFPAVHVQKLLEQIIQDTTEQSLKEKCRTALQNLRKIDS